MYGVAATCQLQAVQDQDCNVVLGNMQLTTLDNLQFATAAQLAFLRKIRRITGRVYIDKSSFDSFSFLSNLEAIDGQGVASTGRVLEINFNFITRSLGFNSLRYIGPGQVYFSDNYFMCLHNTIDYNRCD